MRNHQSGPAQGLPIYEDHLFHVKSGGRTTIVGKLVVRDSAHGHICQSEIFGQKFRFRGELEEDTTDITLLNAVVTHVRHPILTIDENAAVLQHKARQAKDFFRLMETCSGLGGLGMGSTYAGWEVTVQNDVQEKFTKHMNQHENIKNITGSICHLRTIQAMHEVDSQSAAMGWGYACQPFSQLGDGRQGADERSATLPFGLVAAYLLKKELLVLECVTNAATSSFVQRAVQHHLNMVKGSKSEIILELGDIWVSKRRRYWTVINREYMGKVTLQPFPRTQAPPTLGCVLPQFQELAPQQLAELKLTNAEHEAFANIGKGLEAQLIDMTKQAGTALHSWGNQIHACACGCRPGLSMTRLQRQGLHGALVHQDTCEGPVIRHLSPIEMSIMNGLAKQNGWHDEQRMLTAGVGQLASPMQSAWVFSQIRNHLSGMGLGGVTPIDPRKALWAVMQDIFSLRDKWFPQQATCAMQIFQEQMAEFLCPQPPLTASQEEEKAFVEAVHAADRTAATSSTEQKTQQAGGETASVVPTHRTIEEQASSPANQELKHTDIEEGTSITTPSVPADGNLQEGGAEEEDIARDTSPDSSDEGSGDASGNASDHSMTDPEERGEPMETENEGEDRGGGERAEGVSFAQDHSGYPVNQGVDSGDAGTSFVHHHPEESRIPQEELVAGFPGDETTGALAAFMTHEAKTLEHTHPSSSGRTLGVETAFVEHITRREHPSGEMSNKAFPRRRIPKITFDVEELSENGTMVWDMTEGAAWRCKHGAAVKVGHMQQATMHLTQDNTPLRNAVGGLMHPESTLAGENLLIQGAMVSDEVRDLSQLEQHLRVMHRTEALLHQGGAVAVDEMEYYLTSMNQVGSDGNAITIMKPLVVDELVEIEATSQEWFAQAASQGVSVSMILWHHHWIPYVIQASQAGWDISTTWEGVMVWQQLAKVNKFVKLEPAEALPSQFTNDCGFQAFAWMVANLAHTEPEPLQEEQAAGWRRLYWQQLLMRPSQSQVRLGGQGELETAIMTMLKEHGVPNERIHDRMKGLLKAVGTDKLVNAFQSPRPWQAVKHLANTATPRFRLVQEDEIQEIIKARAGPKQAVASRKQPPSTGASSFYVAASEIHVPSAIFCQEGGEPLSQVVHRQFGSNVRGVVVISEQEFLPYLSQGQLSEGGLGFLIIAPYSEEIASKGECLRFPASSTVTGEPLLLSAILVQKGRVKVVRNTPTQLQAVAQVATKTVKLVAFRDQVDMDWEGFCSQQVKHILQWFPILRKCVRESCSCPSWHPTKDLTDGPILDLWQRDTLSIHYKRAKVREAQLFVCFIRVPIEVFQQLFQLSGSQGVYFEPRSHDGFKRDDEYEVIWLAKQDITGAKATQAVLGEASSLLRVGARYGLKVPSKRAQEIHTKLKPNEPFFSGGTRQSYRVGPLPWGSTKQNIHALFGQWGWAAKAIQPCGKAADQSGLMWLVHSTKEPPCLVYTLQHGDVVILREDGPTKQTWKPPQAQASSHMMNMRKKEAETDPWAAAAQHLPNRTTTKVDVTEAHLASLDAKIDRKIQEKLQTVREDSDETMESPMEPRLAMLERQMSQMQTTQQNMQQQANTFEQKLDYLNHHVESQAQQFGQTVDTKLSEQMVRIEALINKRKLNE